MTAELLPAITGLVLIMMCVMCSLTVACTEVYMNGDAFISVEHIEVHLKSYAFTNCCTAEVYLYKDLIA